MSTPIASAATSISRKDSALSRLLAEVTSSNGKLRSELAEDVGKLVSEFSLDNEDGALYRLSSMLEKTSEAVETSPTLDDEASPLARLKREIFEVLAQHHDANVHFQTEVRSTLETFKTRREEAARSTRHGLTFDAKVGEQLERETKRVGDVCEHVGLVPGRLQRKLGDYVVELGPESASPGARIVFEAKAQKSYTMKSALNELTEARKNRDAEVGVLVFDRASAPENMEGLHRVGSDILVVSDAEDVATDVYLTVAFGLARTLAHRACVADSKVDADFTAIDALIDEIAAHVATLEAIEKAARSVTKNGTSILAHAQAMRDAPKQEVEGLRAHVDAARGEAGMRGAKVESCMQWVENAVAELPVVFSKPDAAAVGRPGLRLDQCLDARIYFHAWQREQRSSRTAEVRRCACLNPVGFRKVFRKFSSIESVDG